MKGWVGLLSVSLDDVNDAILLLLARLMGQYCFARWRLSATSVVCNAANGQAGRPPSVGACGQSGGRHRTAGQYGYVWLGRHLV